MIYEKRNQLRNLKSSDKYVLSDRADDSVRTTEITVTSETIGHRSASLPSHSSQSHGDSYSVHVSSGFGPLDSFDETAPSPSIGGATRMPISTTDETHGATPRFQAAKIAKRHRYDINHATWAYTKCAILFFAALLITWIPSSANRVYSLVRPSETNAALELMSSFVLPLQGFWNAVIYIVTSWGACTKLWTSIRFKRGLHFNTTTHKVPDAGAGSNMACSSPQTHLQNSTEELVKS